MMLNFMTYNMQHKSLILLLFHSEWWNKLGIQRENAEIHFSPVSDR